MKPDEIDGELNKINDRKEWIKERTDVIEDVLEDLEWELELLETREKELNALKSMPPAKFRARRIKSDKQQTKLGV